MNDKASGLKERTFVSTVSLFALALLAVSPRSTFAQATADPADLDWQSEIAGIFGLGNENVEKGRLSFLLEEDCGPVIEKYGSCFGNNPASPYGVYEFGDFSGPADSFRWRLARNQAVLFIGRTPPTARYFSFQLYPFSRHRDNLCPDHRGENGRFCDEFSATDGLCLEPRRVLLGRIGLSLNHEEILTLGGGQDPFGKFTIVVTTPNQKVEQHARAFLTDRVLELGLSPDIINIDPVPTSGPGSGECDDTDPRKLVLGSEPGADDFIMALRIAMTESLASQHAYISNPPVTVLRVTFPGLVDNFERYEWAPEPVEPDPAVYNETEYQDALQWVAESIRDAYAPGGAIVPFSRGGGEYYNCIENELSCNAGSEDAYYSKGPDITTRCLARGGSVLVVGVNHSFAGPYSYSNLSVRDPELRHEIGYFADRDYIRSHYPWENPLLQSSSQPPPYLEGSVEHFLPSSVYPRPTGFGEKLRHLYVARVTRTCDPVDDPHCLDVSLEELSVGVLGFQERVYLNTEVGTRPVAENFILSRVILPHPVDCGVTPRQMPGDCTGDATLDVSDGICLLGNLFLGRPAVLPCGDSASAPGNVGLLDSNGDDLVDVSDPIYVFGYLFLGTPPPVLGLQCVEIKGCPGNPRCE